LQAPNVIIRGLPVVPVVVFVMLFFSFFRLKPYCVGVVLGVAMLGGLNAVVANEVAAPSSKTTSEALPPPGALMTQQPGAMVPDEGWEILSEPGKTDSQAPVTDVPSKPQEPAEIDSESLRAIVNRRRLALPLKDAHIVITKANRRLQLYSGDTLIKTYGVALGDSPSGHKQRQGDNRTPEGHFYICTRNAKNSAFHIFLGLSYPGVPDAKRAVNSKQITWREYQLINQRLASRGRPLWETKLGGWVGIHGGSDAAFAKKMRSQRGKNDWTAGCIALTNREIAEIHAATVLGTPVEIKP
jgi:lipoprotein-anchoring transpeptidase ErfK/SrfK